MKVELRKRNKLRKSVRLKIVYACQKLSSFHRDAIDTSLIINELFAVGLIPQASNNMADKMATELSKGNSNLMLAEFGGFKINATNKAFPALKNEFKDNLPWWIGKGNNIVPAAGRKERLCQGTIEQDKPFAIMIKITDINDKPLPKAEWKGVLAKCKRFAKALKKN